MELTKDQKLIEQLGGCAELARKLGLENPKGCRRVYAWYTKGQIPPKWKLDRPDLFLRIV